MARNASLDYYKMTGYLPMVEDYKMVSPYGPTGAYARPVPTGTYMTKERLIGWMLQASDRLGYGLSRSELEAANFAPEDAETIRRQIEGLTITETGKLIVEEPSLMGDIVKMPADIKTIIVGETEEIAQVIDVETGEVIPFAGEKAEKEEKVSKYLKFVEAPFILLFLFIGALIFAFSYLWRIKK